MDTVLPFEYGYLYSPIETKDTEISSDDRRELDNIMYQEGVLSNNSYSDYNAPRLTSTIERLENQFVPVGYNPKTQKVILESTLRETDRFENMVSFNNNQINNFNSFSKSAYRIYRVEVDVNIFIKYFEKVL